MYTEEYEKRGFSIRGILLDIILIILLIIIIIWTIPKLTKSNALKEKSKEEIGVVEQNQSKESKQTVKVENKEKKGNESTYSETFMNNMKRFKKTAISYYKSHLPQKAGETDKLTLNDMVSQHLLVPLVNQKNERYDGDASYVQITNFGDEYLMRVNLKDTEEEAYIWVYIGDYDYCKSFYTECYQSF